MKQQDWEKPEPLQVWEVPLDLSMGYLIIKNEKAATLGETRQLLMGYERGTFKF